MLDLSFLVFMAVVILIFSIIQNTVRSVRFKNGEENYYKINYKEKMVSLLPGLLIMFLSLVASYWFTVLNMKEVLTIGMIIVILISSEKGLDYHKLSSRKKPIRTIMEFLIILFSLVAIFLFGALDTRDSLIIGVTVRILILIELADYYIMWRKASRKHHE